MKTANRIEYIDAAKAIAIVLMIVGHCHWLGAIPRLDTFIYSFHMPLFFIVSGFFLKELPVKIALAKYAKAYLWPYLMIGCFILLIGIAKSLVAHEPWYSLVSLNLTRIAWGSNCESPVLFGDIPHIGPSWFLLALFWGCVLFTFLQKVKGRFAQICLLLIGASFSICSARAIKMPWSIQGGVISVTYLYVGYYVRKQSLLEQSLLLPRWIKLLALLLWLMTSVLMHEHPDVGSARVGFSIVGFTVSLIGTFFVLGLCKRFNLKFQWIGRNTLYILCAHILLWRILEVFGWTATLLPFRPKVNFVIEAGYEIVGAIILAWLLSKTKVLEFRRRK